MKHRIYYPISIVVKLIVLTCLIIIYFASVANAQCSPSQEYTTATRSTDGRVGRIGYRSNGEEIARCTVYLASNGTVITAGHCFPSLTQPDAFVEFNILDSVDDGVNINITRSHPHDLYTIIQDSIVHEDHTSSPSTDVSDYAIFQVQPNIHTSLTPFEAQEDFFRLSQGIPNEDDTIRITQNGIYPGGPIVSNPEWVQATTTATGPYKYYNSVGYTHSYSVDVDNDSSGSPLIWEPSGFSIGFHIGRDGRACDRLGGTAFTLPELAAALNNFHGQNTVHVDKVLFPGATEDGTVFRPYNTLAEGVANVDDERSISIVTGNYTESFAFEENKDIRLIAPAGPVTIRGNITIGKPEPQPELSLSISALSINIEAEASLSAQMFTINNSGTGTLAWTASESIPWLSLSATSGNAPSEVVISIDSSGLAAGDYTGEIQISAGNQMETISVNLTIQPAGGDAANSSIYLPMIVR